jgi:tRNA(fMet)-specific endonuclease VapC
VNKTYMLDTCICSFIMREQPEAVLKRPEQAVLRNHRIVVSAITYAEMRFGATGPKASPRHIELVDAFCARLDATSPWDRAAVDATTEIKVALRLTGTPIGPNDTAIAGHAIAVGPFW